MAASGQIPMATDTQQVSTGALGRLTLDRHADEEGALKPVRWLSGRRAP
jgi:hypothetical protein